MIEQGRIAVYSPASGGGGRFTRWRTGRGVCPRWLAAGFAVQWALVCAGGEWPPPGIALRVPVSRDTWVSSYKTERDANLGRASRLKTKSFQEFTLVDLDRAVLRGKIVTGALLHVRSVSRDVQKRVTVSTLASDWEEGTSPTYRTEPGAASFNWARQGLQRWAWAGSDITAVMNGLGNTLWGFADASPPDARGWQTIPVDPRVVAARIAGISHGFVVFDDVGSEYERRADRFLYHQFPNRYMASREAGADSAPFFTVYVNGSDRLPPEPVRGIASDNSGLPPGRARVTWRTPRDRGRAGVIGFFVRWGRGRRFDWETAHPAPRWLIPMAGRPGDEVVMELRDLPSDLAGKEIRLGICAVDAAGNRGPIGPARITLSAVLPPVLGDVEPPPVFRAGAEKLPRAGSVQVFVIDPLDKLNAETGELLPAHPASYRRANHLWSARTRQVRLYAARNEFVAFQVVLEGRVPGGVSITPAFPDGAVQARVFRGWNVASKVGPLPDPLVPAGVRVHGKDAAGQSPYAVFLVDLFVKHDAAPGLHSGRLDVVAAGRRLTLGVAVRTWDFALPDVLSFVPEMNCYGLPGPPAEVKWYRLAHRNRTCLNRLPYNWRGRPASGCAPEVMEDGFEWTAYDRRFGPILDGSAFDDLPRKGVPVDTFYLPLNENWPAGIEQGFKGGYWADEALTAAYRNRFVRAARGFAAHIEAEGWHGTVFEFYLNGKVYYKKRGWDRCSAPWIFDEPMHTQDFWALRWFGRAFQEGVFPVRGQAALAFRCDISRPQWQRDLLDGLLDVNVVGGAFRQYTRLVMDRKRRERHLVFTYGSPNPISESNAQCVSWCLDAWRRGADGVLPWQTIGKAASWRRADPLALLYPPGPSGLPGPAPSLRLKGFRRGQQDVEYLVLLMRAKRVPRWAVADAVGQFLGAGPEFMQKDAQDAGRLVFKNVGPMQLWRLRTIVGQVLDAASPPPRTQQVDLRPPPRDPGQVPRISVVTPRPQASN